MTTNNMTIKVGGEAGQGVASSGNGFAIALTRGGLHVFGLHEYMSRVRGGHNTFQIRVAENPLHTHTREVNLLLAFVPKTIEYLSKEVVPGGGIIYDENFDVDVDALKARDVRPFPLPLVQISEDLGSKIMANTAALAAAAGITEYDLEYINGVIRTNFAKKGDRIVEDNLEVARRAYSLARERYAKKFEHKLNPREGAPRRMLVNGNQGFCLGALLAGCRFMSAYPMTPATPILEWMSLHAAAYGLVTKHAEDEIAAICMAIGASHAGVRSLVATSGGGFALMVEAISLAGMTEIPVVVVDAQRVGPSTGMPTRTEQADLLFTVFPAHGEFPRIVLAPGTVEQAFNVGWRAFNLAEIYQCPVIVLLDEFLSNSPHSLTRETLGFKDVVIDRGALLNDEDLDNLTDEYKRYLVTETGISARAIPGHPQGIFMACSDEHDEYGHFADEDPANRIRMASKRLRKMETALRDMRPPDRYGPEDADLTLIGWGATLGPVREAVERLNAAGESVNFFHFTDLWPFPEEKVRPLLENARRLVTVENNATGQLAQLLRMTTGISVDDALLRFDGRPFSPEYVMEGLGGML